MSLLHRLRLLWYWIDLRRPTKRDLLWILIGFDIWGLFVIATVGIVLLIDLPTTTASHAGMEQAADAGGGAGVPVGYLSVLLAAAVYEELIFRNGIQKLLSIKLPAWVAIGGTSLLFSSLHFGAYAASGRLTLAVLMTLSVIFGASVAMGIAYHRTQNIVVAIVIHGAINGLAWLSTWI